MPEASVLIVSADPARVETDLAAGAVTCPDCSGTLGPWAHARRRSLRGETGPVELHPRRGRCRSCGKTHVLLPEVALARRVDVQGGYQFIQSVSCFLAFNLPPAAWLAMSNWMALQPPFNSS